MTKQTQGSMLLTGIMAGGIGLVGFLVTLVVGGAGFSTSLFTAILVAAIAGIALFIGFHRRPADPVDPAMLRPRSDHQVPASGRVSAPAPDPTPAPQPPAEPEASPEPVVPDAMPGTVGTKPATYDAAPEGGGDDLKKIKGVGPKLEEMLNSMGIYRYEQVAAWTDEEVAWVDDNVEGFKGRASRDGWRDQAAALRDGNTPPA